MATRDAVLVAQVLGLAPPASGGGGGGGGRAGNNTPPQLPRALAQIFASPAARRLILPVGVGVREDVTKLLDALGLRGEAGGASAPVGVRELAAAELLACLPAGAAVDGAAVRIAPLPLSSAVACCNLGELNSWLGLGRGAGHSAGLESLARQLLGFPRWKRRSVTMSAWETWPLDRAQQLYAALDAVASLRVFDFLAAAMAQTGGTKPVSQPQLYAPAVGEHEGGGV